MKKLSTAIVFTMVTGTASADILYDTYHHLFDAEGQLNSVDWGRQSIVPPDWEAGYFSLGSGAELTKATVLLDAPQLASTSQIDLTNLHVEVWGNIPNQITIGSGIYTQTTDYFPESMIYAAASPTSQYFNGNFGTSIDFTFSNAELQPGDYWLVISNGTSEDIQWFFNGIQDGELIASSFDNGFIQTGSPYIFRMEGITAAPIPGAAWMMGTGLLVLLGARRKLNASNIN